MEWKKRILAAAAVLALAAAVCYGGTRGMAEEKTQSGEGIASWFEERDTLYLWYSDEALTNYLNGASVAFGQREHVRVIPVLTSEGEYLEAVNQASLEGKQPPDVYLLSNDSLEKAYLAGLASEIQDEGQICSEEHFPAAAVSAVTYHGKRIGYPLFYETSALIYNETYLEQWATQQAERELAAAEMEDGEPSAAAEVNTEFDPEALAARTQEYLADALPETVDDILHIADTLDAPEGMSGVMEWDVSDIFYNYWFVGNYMIVGGDSGDDPENIRLDSEEAVRCLEVYKALNQFFSIESDTVTYDSTLQDFIDGKILFTIGTTDAAARLAAAKEDGSLAFAYGFSTMPDVSEDLASRSLSVTNAVVVNGYSPHRELANRFAAFLADEYAVNLYESSGRAAASRSAGTDDGPLSVFALEYEDSVPLPKMMETGNYWMQLEILFSKVWNGADVNEMVQELAAQIALQLQ